jgi:hypothetical protein
MVRCFASTIQRMRRTQDASQIAAYAAGVIQVFRVNEADLCLTRIETDELHKLLATPRPGAPLSLDGA